MVSGGFVVETTEAKSVTSESAYLMEGIIHHRTGFVYLARVKINAGAGIPRTIHAPGHSLQMQYAIKQAEKKKVFEWKQGLLCVYQEEQSMLFRSVLFPNCKISPTV